MNYRSGRQSNATVRELKLRLKHHAENAHEDGVSDDCQACQTLLKLIKKRERVRKI